MTNDEKEDYKRLLIREYWTLKSWEPDREEHGFQSGPSEEEIDVVVRKIKKLDSSWKTPEELDELDYYKTMDFLTESYLEQAFPEFYGELFRHLDQKSQKFIKQQQRVSLKDMTPKQRKWVLSLLTKYGAKDTAEQIHRYL